MISEVEIKDYCGRRLNKKSKSSVCEAQILIEDSNGLIGIMELSKNGVEVMSVREDQRRKGLCTQMLKIAEILKYPPIAANRLVTKEGVETLDSFRKKRLGDR